MKQYKKGKNKYIAIAKQVELAQKIKEDFPNLGIDFLNCKFLTSVEANKIYKIQEFYNIRNPNIIQSSILMALSGISFQKKHYSGLINPKAYKIAAKKAKSEFNKKNYKKGIGIGSIPLKKKKEIGKKCANLTNKLMGHIDWSKKIKTTKYGVISLEKYVYKLSKEEVFKDHRGRNDNSKIIKYLKENNEIEISKSDIVGKAIKKYTKSLENLINTNSI